MIEATLDRTLVAPNPSQTKTTELVGKELEHMELPMPFEAFISCLVQTTKAPQAEVEDAFWILIDRGQISLSTDFHVKRP
jgi:hypothetical protein